MSVCQKCSATYSVHPLAFDSGLCKSCKSSFWALPLSKENPNVEWPYRLMFLLVFFTLVAHFMFMPCLCRMGMIKLQAGLYLDILVLLRVLVARIFKTKGIGWYTYPILLLASLFVIPAVFG